MAIIETLKQGNNEYKFNKEFLNIDSSGYFFTNTANVFERWFRSPLYISSSETNLSKLTYDFKKPHGTMHTRTTSDFELHHIRSDIYNLINDEEDAGYLFFVFPTLFKSYIPTSDVYNTRYSRSYDNFYSNQFITDIDFNNNDDIIVSNRKVLVTQRKIRIRTSSGYQEISSSFKYCSSPTPGETITHQEIRQDGTVYTVTDGYKFEYKTFGNTSIKMSDFSFSGTDKKII